MFVCSYSNSGSVCLCVHSNSMFVYVCMYVCMYVYMCACMHVCVYVCVFMYKVVVCLCMHVCVYVCMRAYVHVSQVVESIYNMAYSIVLSVVLIHAKCIYNLCIYSLPLSIEF